MDLLADMSQNIRIDRSKSEIRIYAINNEELNHCFDLIDRTPLVYYYKSVIFSFNLKFIFTCFFPILTRSFNTYLKNIVFLF